MAQKWFELDVVSRNNSLTDDDFENDVNVRLLKRVVSLAKKGTIAVTYSRNFSYDDLASEASALQRSMRSIYVDVSALNSFSDRHLQSQFNSVYDGYTEKELDARADGVGFDVHQKYAYFDHGDEAAVDALVARLDEELKSDNEYSSSMGVGHEDVDGYVVVKKYFDSRQIQNSQNVDYADYNYDSTYVKMFEPILTSRGRRTKNVVMTIEWNSDILLAFRDVVRAHNEVKGASDSDDYDIVGVRAQGPKHEFNNSLLPILTETIKGSQTLVGDRPSMNAAAPVLPGVVNDIANDRNYFFERAKTQRRETIRDARKADKKIDDIVDAFWTGNDSGLGVKSSEIVVFSPAGWVPSRRTRASVTRQK